MNKINMLVLTCITTSIIHSEPLPIEQACEQLTFITTKPVLLAALNEHQKSFNFLGKADCTLQITLQHNTALWHTLNSHNQNKIYNHKTDYAYELNIGDKTIKDTLSHDYFLNDKKNNRYRFISQLMHAINHSLTQNA